MGLGQCFLRFVFQPDALPSSNACFSGSGLGEAAFLQALGEPFLRLFEFAAFVRPARVFFVDFGVVAARVGFDEAMIVKEDLQRVHFRAIVGGGFDDFGGDVQAVFARLCSFF